MMVAVARDLETFIVDCNDDDEEGSIAALHQAAWRGDVATLQLLLQNQRHASAVNIRVRPFLATPLRLAVSNGQTECAQLLLSQGASVDLPDRKNQTPLFCAVKSKDLASCKILLKAGASPEGHAGNLSTPLQIACQEGFSPGLQLLLDHGAAVESISPEGVVRWTHPLHIASTYGHLSCYIALLCAGVRLDRVGHILHVICSRKWNPVFVRLWWEFGGSLWYRDKSGQLAVDIPGNLNAPLLRTLMETPLSLQSLCRLKIRSSYPALDVEKLSHPYVRDFLQYYDFPEVRAYQKLVRQELETPTGLDLEAKLKEFYV